MTGNKDLDTFHLAFMGEQVVITTDKTATVTTSNELGFQTEVQPIFYEGILLDQDDDFYYLGVPKEIMQAVSKKSVVHVMLSDSVDIYGELLDQMPDPNRNEDVN